MESRANLNRIRALATDVDGTITDKNKKLSLKAVKKIRELEELGISVILITGHVFPVVSGLADYIQTSGPVVAEGGAVVGFPWKLEFKLGKSVPPRAVKLMRKIGFKDTESNNYRHQDLSFHRNGKKMKKDEIRDVLKRNGMDVDVYDSGYAVHLSPKGIDKAAGLLKALEIVKVNMKNIAVIGDSSFDSPMYRVAGISAAPKDAPKILKKESTILLNSVLPHAFVDFAKLIIRSRTS